MPIGIYERMDKFTTKEIQFEKDDTVYLFSDGYPDQFGGPQGKKLKTKYFQEVLLKYHSQPMAKQNTTLEKTLKDWQGDYEQIDDITIFGFKM